MPWSIGAEHLQYFGRRGSAVSSGPHEALQKGGMVRHLDESCLGLALAASLALAGCSPRTPEPVGGAAPASPDAAPQAIAGDSGARTTSEAAAPAAPAQQAPVVPAATTAATSPDSGFVQYDAATKTVTFRLVSGPFEFNGFSNGGATLTVPPGSTNVWTFEQSDGTPHSAQVGSGTGPVASEGGDPAIPRAYTNKVVEGLVQGAKDVIRFTAPDSGTFRIECGVPGHALSGMWLWLKVDPAAKSPTFGATPKS
jgi:hypothetical protein